MKKLAIAASSVALAAMPVVSTFAEDVTSVHDTLTLQISKSCTFDSTIGSGDFKVGTPMLANETANFTGRTDNVTELKVYCNETSYTVGAAFSSLDGFTENSYTTTNNDAITYNAAQPTGGSGTWAAHLDSGKIGSQTSTAAYLTTGTNIMSSNSGVTGDGTNNYDNAVISYSVSSGSHKAGYYRGTATYTLTGTNS